MLRAEQAEIYLFVPTFMTFWGTLVANEDNKNLSNKAILRKLQSPDLRILFLDLSVVELG